MGSFESSAQLYPKAVVQFPITYPGFITLLPNISDGSRSSWDIIISRFNGFPFSTDYVSIVRDIGQAMTEGHSVNPVEEITSELHWPNEAKYIPGKDPPFTLEILEMPAALLYKLFIILTKR